MKSAAISAAFSLVMALGEFCSPASNTYSSVPPSLAAPRYRNSSTAKIGVAAITKAARIRKRTVSDVLQRLPWNHVWKLVDESQQHFNKGEQLAYVDRVHQN